MIALVAAVARNGAIGRHGGLPWHLPDDLKRFRELTRGHTVVMGRATFESIVDHLSHPLPDRQSIVVTRDENFSYPDVRIVHDPAVVVDHATTQEPLFVIGGAMLYSALLPYAEKLYISEVLADVEGDTYFPDYDKTQWRETSRIHHAADNRHEYAFDFVEYTRA